MGNYCYICSAKQYQNIHAYGMVDALAMGVVPCLHTHVVCYGLFGKTQKERHLFFLPQAKNYGQCQTA